MAADLAQLRDLRERLARATSEDPELGARVLCVVLAPAGSKVEQSRFNGAWCIYEPREYGREPFGLWAIPSPWRRDDACPTGSIDAAVALVAKKLPDWKVGTASPDPTRPGLHTKAWAKVEPFHGNDAGWKFGAHEGFAATVPLAILVALCRALIAEMEAVDA